MLRFEHVSVSCRHTPILEDITVTFPKGKITTIIGPNGCGKTTLLQCLNGTSHIDKGSVLLDDCDFSSLTPGERAKRLSFLPQVRTIIPVLPVKTLVEHGRFPYLGFSRRKSERDRELIAQAMEFTNISSYAGQSVDTLSGGIRQKAFFAMTLAQDCDYVVLDEPATYLDLKGQQELYLMFQRLKAQGKTVILVLHDLNQALRISDYMIVMNNRKIAAAGTPQECLQQHIIEAVFDITIKHFSDGEDDYYFFL